jgi:hypothetical protein
MTALEVKRPLKLLLGARKSSRNLCERLTGPQDSADQLNSWIDHHWREESTMNFEANVPIQSSWTKVFACRVLTGQLMWANPSIKLQTVKLP